MGVWVLEPWEPQSWEEHSMVEEEEGDTQDVAGGRGMHRVERKDSSCQMEVPVHVAGRRDKLLERTESILSSLILEVCWEETTTITVAAAVITTTEGSMGASTVEDSTMVEASMEDSTTFMELVKGLITLVGGGVTLLAGITKDVVTYSHLTGIRTILGLTMPAVIMVS